MNTLSMGALWVVIAALIYSIIQLELKCRSLLATVIVQGLQMNIYRLRHGQSPEERNEVWDRIDSGMKSLADVNKALHDDLASDMIELRSQYTRAPFGGMS